MRRQRSLCAGADAAPGVAAVRGDVAVRGLVSRDLLGSVTAATLLGRLWSLADCRLATIQCCYGPAHGAAQVWHGTSMES